MPMPKKKCKKCEAENAIGNRVCSKCGEPFKFKKREKARPTKPAAQGFSAGLTNDGGLMFYWFERDEFVRFTKEEADAIRRALANPSPNLA